MKFILHSLNYYPELTGVGKYNGEMCSELAKRDVEVSAIVAPPYYPEWQLQKGHSALSYSNAAIDGVSVTRCPIYIPKKVSTIGRILHLCSFSISSTFALFSKLSSKPDVILLVQPTLFCAPSVLIFSKLTGAKAIMHIQDFELDALFGLGMLGEGKIARLAKKTERWLLSKFDGISCISHAMLNNAKSKGVPEGKMIFFPNWSDTDFVTPYTDGSSLKKEWGYSSIDKVVLYAGNIGHKQGLEIVLQAAAYFKDQSNVKFLFVGSGANVDELKNTTNEMNLTNVSFKPLQDWDKVPEMLSLADVHLVVQKKGAADAVLPSKLTNILSAGGYALVTAEQNTELGQLQKKFPGIFSCVDPECIDSFIHGLDNLLSSDLTVHNKVARNYADQYLAKDKILEKFFEDILSRTSKYNTPTKSLIKDQ